MIYKPYNNNKIKQRLCDFKSYTYNVNNRAYGSLCTRNVCAAYLLQIYYILYTCTFTYIYIYVHTPITQFAALMQIAYVN